ncbi:MAG: hypothetical protein AAF804_06495 [Bacteroidota bacterium]
MSPHDLTPEGSLLFQSVDFSVYLCLHQDSLRQALLARSHFYQVAEDLKVSPQGDDLDWLPNAKVFTVWRHGQILGTIRNLVYNQAYQWQDCMLSRYHPRSLDALEGPETPLLESSRFAVAPGLDRRTAFQVQGILFRVQVMANQSEDIRHVTTIVRPNHIRFYEKYMSMRVIDEEMEYDGHRYTVMAVPALEKCTFSYSQPEALGIDEAACLIRYAELKAQLLSNPFPSPSLPSIDESLS